MNVRRLAAIDMYGTSGSVRRRRIILAEFLVGVVGMVGIGFLVLLQSTEMGGRALGLWFVGAGLNYGPLAVYAVMLSRPGALDAELVGVERSVELRRYGVLQLWILVPFSLIVMGAADALIRRKRH